MESASTIVREFKETRLHITKCQAEYNNKIGLSKDVPSSTQDADLPLHPRALSIELSDYKDHFAKLKRDYIEQETKASFLQTIRQDPPPSITDHDIYPFEKQAKSFKNTLKQTKDGTRRHKLDLEELCHAINQSWKTLQTRVDDMARVIDECREKEAECARIHALLRHQSSLSPEEAKTILSQQEEELRQLETEISGRGEALEDMEYRIEDNEQRAHALLERLTVAEKEAAEAIRQCEHRDETVEERTRWYTNMTDMCNRLFGIDHMEFISATVVMVTYATPNHEQLRIELDPVTQRAVDAALISRSGSRTLNVKDLVVMARQCPPKDAIKLIILETLSRLKKVAH